MEVDNSSISTTRQSTVPQESNNIALLTCIRTTQAQLGKHILKPPLLLKYLVQPPFLFFHDIITTVIRTKGFLKGLYTEDELDRIKARSLKENRIRFFDKLIKALQATTGERFPKFNLAKMSIGRHPLSVNRLLHSIAFALDMEMNSDMAVMKIIGESSSDYQNRGEKRKICESSIDEDEYFGDDESEMQPRFHKVQNKKGMRREKSLMTQVENDDAVSMAYESDMVLLNGPHLDFQNKVMRPLSSLSIYDDSDKKMDII